MRLFLYSDLHISRTSSILPNTSDNNKYTYRQNMLLKTGEYMSSLVEKEMPDAIINLGDTFDQHTVTSYDINVASEFFNYFDKFTNIPHYVLVGNHEMINQDFNAIALLNNIPNIQVIDKPTTIGDLGFLPYCDYKDILEFPDGKYLFSHQDIQGSSIRGNFVLSEGIDTNILSKYKLVFNGHIHKYSIMKNVINVGSVTTHSFSDDESTVPQCYIFDTDTFDLKTFKINVSPLFRRLDIEASESELQDYINTCNRSYKYILHITCPFEIKDNIRNILSANNDVIIASRLNIKIANKTSELEDMDAVSLQATVDIKQTFKEFLNIGELKYPKEIYLDVLQEVK